MREDGGPAFPISVAVGPAGDVYSSWDVHTNGGGMTLRDHFAGQALNGILASFPEDGTFATRASKLALAADAYELADAMLAERTRKPNHMSPEGEGK